MESGWVASASITGSWKGGTDGTAGGCTNYASWRFNTQLFLSCSAACTVTLSLKQKRIPQMHLIGLYVAKTNGASRQLKLVKPLIARTKFHRSSTVSVSFDMDPSMGPLVIVPSTFEPEQENTWRVKATTEAPVLQLRPLGPTAEYRVYRHSGEWKGSSAGGCKNVPTFVNNPQFYVQLKKPATVHVVISQPKEDFSRVGVYVATGSTTRVSNFRGSSILTRADFKSPLEAYCRVKLEKTNCSLIPCTFEAGHEGTFDMILFSKERLRIRDAEPEPLELSQRGEWRDQTSGGCVKFSTWRNNPQYFLYAHTSMTVTIVLRRKRVSGRVGFYVARNPVSPNSRVLMLGSSNLVGKSKFEEKKKITLTLDIKASKEPYIIIPCPYKPNTEAKFQLTVQLGGIQKGTDTPLRSLAELLPCTFLWYERLSKGEWAKGASGGPRTGRKWALNPQFNLKIGAQCFVVIILRYKPTSDDAPRPAIGFDIIRDSRVLSRSVCMTAEEAAEANLVASVPHKASLEVDASKKLRKGIYKLVPSTGVPGVHGAFELAVYCESKMFTLSRCVPNDDSEISPVGSVSRHSSTRRPRRKRADDSRWEIDWDDVQYDAENLIGQGGYGVVYRGSYKGRDVAVKKMLCELMDEGDLDAVRKEIQIMSQYRHPSIVGFVGACLIPPNVAILSEFCLHGNMKSVLSKQRDLKWSIKLRMAIQTSEGMEYLHSQNPPVVHRDLKSLNLLVTSKMDVKICDFGMSKTTSGASLNSQVGSLNWCAPEVLLHNAPFTMKADVYSMGMVLYELYTHRPPFYGCLPLEIVRRINSGDLLPIPEECPVPYQALIEACWKSEPESRPSFRQILKTLQRMKASVFPAITALSRDGDASDDDDDL